MSDLTLCQTDGVPSTASINNANIVCLLACRRRQKQQVVVTDDFSEKTGPFPQPSRPSKSASQSGLGDLPSTSGGMSGTEMTGTGMSNSSCTGTARKLCSGGKVQHVCTCFLVL